MGITMSFVEPEALVPIRQSKVVREFTCLGSACEDTCCRGWGMQVMPDNLARYSNEAPELLLAVDQTSTPAVMRRDATSDACVKLSEGWCGIHAKYGERLLGDACHFYPRITRALGSRIHMTASMSCPEVVRLTLFGVEPFAEADRHLERLPTQMRDYLPQGMEEDAAIAVHERFMAIAADASRPAMLSLLYLRIVAEALDTQPVTHWPAAAEFYTAQAAGRLPMTEPNPADPFNLLNALQGLIGAAHRSPRSGLMAVIATMEKALAVTLDWQNLTIATGDKSWPSWLAIAASWKDGGEEACEPILRRCLEAQLNMAWFPFAGLGSTLSERISIIGVRMATLRLALMSAVHLGRGALPEAETVRIIQSLSRFLDHLTDPEFSLRIYRETGWLRTARLRALVGI